MTNLTESFFERFLTFRHLLTRRLTTAGVLAAGLILPVGFWFVASDLGSLQSSSQDPENLTSRDGPRLLTVATRELSAAGPTHLLQSYTGVVAARRFSQLASKTIARVESVLVDLGDQVEAEQLLIQLDVQQLNAERQLAAANLKSAQARLDELSQGPRSQDIEQAAAQVRELQANLELSRANFERVTDLRRSSAISKQEYDESRYALDAMAAKLESSNQNLEMLREGSRVEQIEAQVAVVAGMEAQLKRIDADIADRSILAPFAGSILARRIDEGSIVSPSQALMEIMECAPYEVRLGLPPEVAQNLSTSQIVVSIRDQPLDANLQRIAPGINESTRSREIILELSESSSSLVNVGSAVNVSVQVPVESDGYWVPSACLTAGARGLWAIHVVSEVNSPSSKVGDIQQTAKIERRQVELVRAQGAWSEIQGPLSPNDRLVFEGVHRATPGQIVRVVEADADEYSQSR